MLNQQRFEQLWHRLTGQQAAAGLFTNLALHYDEPARSYHNASHITDCLEQFDIAIHLAAHPHEVEAALWFHDVIYDPKAKNNEEQSAAWAVKGLQQAQVGNEIMGRITSLILATKHTQLPADNDEKLIVDIDLSILGRAPEVFARYDGQIRDEYSWVPEEQYRSGRSAILKGFLQRKTIYSTDFFRGRYEAQARFNIADAVKRIQTVGTI